MTNTIKLKRGSGSDPAASDMVVGEPVLRSDTAELFFKKDDGSVAKVSGGGGGGSSFQYLALRNAANDGAASYPANDFTLVTSGTTTAVSPATANALILSYGGVVQKPNSGTSTSGITGFIVDGSRLKTATNFAAAPDFIVYQESGGIGEPSDNTVTSAKIVDGAIVNADINASAAIAGSKINPNFVSQEITGGRLSLLDNGSTSPTLLIAGDDGNPWGIQLRNDTYATGGEGLKIFQSNTGITYFQTRGTSARGRLVMQQHNGTTTNNMIEFTEAGAVEIDHAGNKKLQTNSTGIQPFGNVDIQSGGSLFIEDGGKLEIGNSQDLEIYHVADGNSFINDTATAGQFIIQAVNGHDIKHSNGELAIRTLVDGATSLYWGGTSAGKKFDTQTNGTRIYDSLGIGADSTSTALLNLKTPDGSSGNNTTKAGIVVKDGSYADGALIDCQDSVGGSVFKVLSNGESQQSGDLIISTSGNGIRANGPNNSTYGELKIQVDVPDGSGSNNEATFKKASSGIVLAFPSGGGIDFSANANATGNTSNLFDDYESGTWTASMVTGTCSEDSCKYIKIGNQVTVWGRVHSFSDTSTNIILKIQGLPYAVNTSNAGGNSFQKHISTEANCPYVTTNETISFYGHNTANAWQYVTHLSCSSGAYIYFYATYRSEYPGSN